MLPARPVPYDPRPHPPHPEYSATQGMGAMSPTGILLKGPLTPPHWAMEGSVFHESKDSNSCVCIRVGCEL